MRKYWLTRFVIKLNLIILVIFREEIFLKPLLKTLFAVKNPKLLKRDLDVVVFVLINAMRGVLLGTSLMLEQNHTKEKLKSELNFLILTYLEAMT